MVGWHILATKIAISRVIERDVANPIAEIKIYSARLWFIASENHPVA
jgi:hypothetical protein